MIFSVKLILSAESNLSEDKGCNITSEHKEQQRTKGPLRTQGGFTFLDGIKYGYHYGLTKITLNHFHFTSRIEKNIINYYYPYI